MAKYLLYLLVCLYTLRAAEETEATKLEKLMQLNEIDDVIKLTPETFSQFVTKQSKQYIIVVLFSTTVQHLECPPCALLNPIFKQIAYSYKVYNYHKPWEKEGKKQKAVIFAQLDFSQSALETFKKFGFMNLPNIYVSHKGLKEEAGFRFNADRSKLWEFSPAKNIEAQAILDFINKKTEKEVEMQYSFMDKYQEIITYTVLAVSLAVFAVYVVRNLMNPVLWWVGGMVVYVICVGGVVYDILHGVPLMGIDQQTGESQLFSPGNRSQYVYEGFLMSATMVLSAAGLILINVIAKFESRWLIRLVFIIGYATFVMTAYQVDKVYKMKTSWYSPSFNPPSGYKQGPLLVDQGNSF